MQKRSEAGPDAGAEEHVTGGAGARQFVLTVTSQSREGLKTGGSGAQHSAR